MPRTPLHRSSSLILGHALVFASAIALGAPGLARSAPFGGFSADETRYLVGRDTICTPLAIRRATADEVTAGSPACTAAAADRVAAAKFRKGALQRGRQAEYEARSSGTSIRVLGRSATGASAQPIASWNTTDPIARITGVYLSANGTLLAVEYETRLAGRPRTEVVGFVLPRPDADDIGHADADAGRRPAPATAPSPTVDPPAAPPAVQQVLTKARKLSKRGRSKAAVAAYRRVLASDADHAEARYGLARNLARQGKRAEALRELATLAASRRADAIVWRVESRFDQAFAKLRDDPAFRQASGLDRPKASQRPLYERLLGFSNTWEQPEVKCEQAEISLAFERLARTFRLLVTSRCGGYKDTTRLGGRFSLHAAEEVRLNLPNKKKADEVLPCRLTRCTDGSGEDCLHCAVDTDLEFMARPVRR